MSNLMIFNKMTSMQIAEVTRKLHHHVIRDITDEIEKLQKAGIDTATKFGLRQRDGLTGSIPYYELSKEGILQLAARYDAVVRAKLIELAMKQDETRPQVPQTFAEALRLAADYWEENQKLLPKAESYDSFIGKENLYSIGVVAKKLAIPNMGERNLFNYLRGRGILCSSKSHWNEPKQEHVASGYFVLRDGAPWLDKKGEEHVNKQCFVSPKGVDFISRTLKRDGYVGKEQGEGLVLKYVERRV